MKKVVLLGSILGILIFSSGCSMSDWAQEKAPQLFRIKIREEIGDGVKICSQAENTCLVAQEPIDEVFGIIRGGKFDEGDEKLCHPLGEYCDKVPLGPIIPGVEVKVWQYVSDEEVGALIANTYTDNSGFYGINPLPGTYWLTFHKVSGNYAYDSKNKELFGKEVYHRIIKVAVSEDKQLKLGIYLQE